MARSIVVGSLALLTAATTGCTTGAQHRCADFRRGQPPLHVIDLSHKLTTFRPSSSTSADKRFAADLAKPIGTSRPVSAFSGQMVLVETPDLRTGDGVFKLNTTVLAENIGTSIDCGAHFVPNRPEVANPDQRGLADLTVEDLSGPVIVIDISARVEAELEKNEGIPGRVRQPQLLHHAQPAHAFGGGSDDDGGARPRHRTLSERAESGAHGES